MKTPYEYVKEERDTLRARVAELDRVLHDAGSDSVAALHESCLAALERAERAGPLEVAERIAAAREEQREACARFVGIEVGGARRPLYAMTLDTPLDATPLADRIKALEAWQLAVADGIGFVNRAEGQDGYEVAKPSVIVGYVKGLERDSDIYTAHALRADLATTAEVTARLTEERDHATSELIKAQTERSQAWAERDAALALADDLRKVAAESYRAGHARGFCPDERHRCEHGLPRGPDLDAIIAKAVGR